MAQNFQFCSFSCLILTFLCCVSFLEAKNEVVIGGRSGLWKIPSSPDSFTQWAQKSRFKVGDSIVFKYDAGKDSVLEVTKEAYKNCNTTNPISKHSDGHTAVTLRRPGPFYFISGADGHCGQGQKLFLVVVTPRSSVSSPAPSPAEFDDGPAVAPTVGAAASSQVASVVMFVGFGVSLLMFV